LWLGWLAGIAVTAYGLRSRGLLGLTLWDTPDLRRLVWFAAGWAAASIVFFFRARRWFPAAILLFHAAWLWTVNGPAPLAAHLWAGASAVAIGLRLLPCSGRPLVTGALAWLAGMAAIQVVMTFTAHFPVNTTAVWIAALGVPIVLWRQRLLAWAHECALCQRVTAAHHFGRALAAFALSLVFAQVLGPEVGSDALTVHLRVPFTVERLGEWHFDVRQFTWAVMPLGVDWTYTVSHLLGGEHAARLVNFLFLCAIVVILYSTARRWLRPGMAYLAAAAFASNPLVPLETGHLFIENGLAAYISGSVWLIPRLRREPAGLFPAALLLAAAIGSKLGALPYAVPLLVAALALAWRATPAWQRAAVFSGAVATGGFPFFFAWRATGNPIFPFENQYFLSPLYLPEKFVNLAFVEKLSAASLFLMTFDSPKYLEAVSGGAMGFATFAFAPLIAVALMLVRPMLASAVFLFAVAAAAIVCSSQPYIRYVYPSIALWIVPLAAAIYLARRLGGRWFSGALAVSLLAAVVLQIYFRPSSAWHQRRFPLYTAPAHAAAYEMETASVRPLVRDLMAHAPGEKVLFLDVTHPPELGAAFETYSWHTTPFAVALRKCGTPEEVLALVRAAGIRRVVAPVVPPESLTPPIRAFIARYLERTWTAGAAAAFLVTGTGGASSIELLPRDWTGTALRQTITIVLPARYRFAVDARCPGDGQLRMRIVWRAAGGSPAGSDERFFVCSQRQQTVELITLSPAGAAEAELTVEVAAAPLPPELKNPSFRNLPDAVNGPL
jgi:hypothetical protein